MRGSGLRAIVLSHSMRPGGAPQVAAIRDSLGTWEALANEGVEVVRMCPAADADTALALRALSQTRLRVLPVPLKASKLGGLAFVPQLKRKLQSIQGHVVHIVGEPWQGGVARAVLACRSIGLPVGVHFAENGPALTGARGYLRSTLGAFALKRSDYIVGWSAAAVAVARDHFQYRGTAEVFPSDGVPRIFFEAVGRPRRERDGLLFVGRLVPEKGVLDALFVARSLPSDIRLTVIGDGPLAASLRTDSSFSRVRFLGQLPRLELSDFMGKSLLTLVPSGRGSLPSAFGGSTSWEEQFGRVIAESLAAGTPVVGYDSGQVRETMGKGGTVVPPGDKQRLMEEVLRLVNDEEAWTKASCEASKRSHDYSEETIASRLVGLWRSLGIGS